MKAHAIGGRDKPKDTYDLCYCLEHFPGGMESSRRNGKTQQEKNIVKAVEILREKFASVDAFGPQQLVEFYAAPTPKPRRCTPGVPTNWCRVPWFAMTRQ